MYPSLSHEMVTTVQPVFTTIDHGRTSDAVVRQIESLILEGVLRDGDRLPGERDLAASMNVSRPVLREALKALEARGLIVARQGGGNYVADVVGEVFSAPMRELIAAHPKATADYLEYRREIEAITAEMAARRSTSADRQMIASIIQRMEEVHAAGDFDAEAEIDVEFHNAVGECAHNFILLHSLRSCYRLLSDGVFQSRAKLYHLRGAREALLAQHRSIAGAILAGDAAAAREAAMAHIDFIVQATAESERADDWQRVAQLRLQHRLQGRAPSSQEAISQGSGTGAHEEES
jgi:GntR family transcriptional repressor for pyruvate dehydrogenase complex